MRARGSRVPPPREANASLEILVPCFNQGQYLAEALSSIGGWACAVTVIDDTSTDDTPEYVRCLSGRFHFSSMRNESNLGQGESLNIAISRSPNDLFMVLNADDLLLPYTLSAVTQVFADYPQVRLVGGSSIHFADSTTKHLDSDLARKLGYHPVPNIWGPKDALQFARLNDLNMTMSSCTFFKSAWREVGGFRRFDDRVCSYDDRDFQMRVAAVFPVAVLDEPLAFYRLGSSIGKGQE